MKLETDLDIGDVVETSTGFLGKVYSIKVLDENKVSYEIEYKSSDTDYTHYDRVELTKFMKEK
jgi:preprotein translocase subunit YajC